MESTHTRLDAIYAFLSDDELRGAFHAAGVRIDLLHGRKDLHPTEGKEFVRLTALSEIQRSELERETLGVVSNIRAEFRRRGLRATIAR
jgi:hypothetical protein